MSVKTLKTIFKRDLIKLKIEIESYKNENVIWKTENAIANSAGNLTLHLIGNLNSFIGAQIGKTNYIRTRELEFLQKNISKQELINNINKTIDVVEKAMSLLNEADLEKEYPILVFDKKTTIDYFLIHLTTHLSYHLGQINYHRRLLDTN